MQPFNTLLYTVWPSVAGLTKPSELLSTQFIARLSLSGFLVIKPHFFPFFPLPFNINTTKRWQVANKETFWWHSWALWPSWLSWSTQPSQLTQHYQDYDVNYDDRVAYSCSHSIHFPIQCSLLWSALLSLLSFYQHSSIPRLSISCPHRASYLLLYTLLSTLQSITPSPFTLPIVNTVPPAPLSLTHNGSSCILSHSCASPTVQTVFLIH